MKKTESQKSRDTVPLNISNENKIKLKWTCNLWQNKKIAQSLVSPVFRFRIRIRSAFKGRLDPDPDPEGLKRAKKEEKNASKKADN
jgi:hypothetical protein